MPIRAQIPVATLVRGRDAGDRLPVMVSRSRYTPLFSLVADIVTYWGTGPETALYVRMLTQLLGGEDA